MTTVAHHACRPMVRKRKTQKRNMVRLNPRGFMRKMEATREAAIKRIRLIPDRSGMNPEGRGSRGRGGAPAGSEKIYQPQDDQQNAEPERKKSRAGPEIGAVTEIER